MWARKHSQQTARQEGLQIRRYFEPARQPDRRGRRAAGQLATATGSAGREHEARCSIMLMLRSMRPIIASLSSVSGEALHGGYWLCGTREKEFSMDNGIRKMMIMLVASCLVGLGSSIEGGGT